MSRTNDAGPAQRLAARLGLPVRDLGLLEQALVHSSYLHEHRDGVAGHNERLEYLGDSVIDVVIAEALFRRFPDDDEGALSARRAAIVSTNGLAALAERIDLGSYVLLGEGESSESARHRHSLLASTLEAVVGALYLDLGFGTARDWVLELAEDELAGDRPADLLKSPKSRLQELTQREIGSRPIYRLLDVSGPDHARTFRVEVVLGERVLGTGSGASRRDAETIAAEAALATLAADGTPGTAGSPGDGS